MRKAFVYIWSNITNGKKYIGYHVGDEDDGYISSSHNKLFWEDFNNNDMVWSREIVFTGDSESCLLKEQSLLREINLSDDRYYNNARGSEIIFTDEVRKKMSLSGKKRWENMSDEDKSIRNMKISESKKGIPRKENTKKRISEKLKGRKVPEETIAKIVKKNTGKKRADKFKREQSERFLGDKNPMYGKKHSEKFVEVRRRKWIEDNPNKNGLSEEHKRKLSESKKGTPSPFKGVPRKRITCPYCGKEGGEGLMHRWHFDNCKHK
jgi:hypothetical protein